MWQSVEYRLHDKHKTLLRTVANCGWETRSRDDYYMAGIIFPQSVMGHCLLNWDRRWLDLFFKIHRVFIYVLMVRRCAVSSSLSISTSTIPIDAMILRFAFRESCQRLPCAFLSEQSTWRMLGLSLALLSTSRQCSLHRCPRISSRSLVARTLSSSHFPMMPTTENSSFRSNSPHDQTAANDPSNGTSQTTRG